MSVSNECIEGTKNKTDPNTTTITHFQPNTPPTVERKCTEENDIDCAVPEWPGMTFSDMMYEVLTVLMILR